MKILLYTLVCVACLSLLSLQTSCQKDTTCKVTVTCSDSSGKYVNNAFVRLYALVKNSTGKEDTADVRVNGNTDGSGQISFTFKYPAIYDVDARTVIGSTTYSALGVVKLEEGTTVQKALTLHR